MRGIKDSRQLQKERERRRRRRRRSFEDLLDKVFVFEDSEDSIGQVPKIEKIMADTNSRSWLSLFRI